ncbi:hypothetical protein A9Q89_03535 [Gammaproteobacteria bacterium 53_120_T64]|nr:hypothetical protein A9Q89_03535 [Gammaproteobacteria bacterium 53_120_T64]
MEPQGFLQRGYEGHTRQGSAGGMGVTSQYDRLLVTEGRYWLQLYKQGAIARLLLGGGLALNG